MAKKIVPDHWKTNSWEEKAQENPLYAVMTMPEMEGAGADEFSEEHLQLFFEKGRKLADRLVMPSLASSPETGLVVEYGCGAGRILNALVERSISCAGIDISQTMLYHCKELVPGVESLHCLDVQGRVSLPNECARLVYSYAVLQHIDKLSSCETAIFEMSRLLAPTGRLVLQVNCEDFTLKSNGQLGRTENFEDHSIHYAPGSTIGVVHKNTTWSGVYIGLDSLTNLLLQYGVSICGVMPFSEKKPRAIVVIGVKSENY